MYNLCKRLNNIKMMFKASKEHIVFFKTCCVKQCRMSKSSFVVLIRLLCIEIKRKTFITFLVTWEVETKIIRISENVVLTCTVHEVKAIDIGEPRQWYTESSLVCYNGKPTNPLKYMEALYKNKFKLLIYNVTEADLNRDYQCLYSFDVFSKTLNITEDNFECKYMTSYNINM